MTRDAVCRRSAGVGRRGEDHLSRDVGRGPNPERGVRVVQGIGAVRGPEQDQRRDQRRGHAGVTKKPSEHQRITVIRTISPVKMRAISDRTVPNLCGRARSTNALAGAAATW